MKKNLHEEFTIPITVEFEDVDSFGIAHHTKMIAYLERARARYFAERQFKLTKSNIHPVLYNVEMEFKKTVEFMDQLGVSIFVKSLEPYRLVFGYRIRRQGELVAKASTTLAFIDPETKKLVPVPADYFS